MTQPPQNPTVSPLPNPPSDLRPPVPQQMDRTAEIERQGPRNLFVLAMYQVVLRVGWIFKTETVIMPAFLDAIAGAAWIRGFLPVLNRFGQSVPPLLFAERLQHMPRKKWALTITGLLMAVPFLILSPIWLGLGWLSVDRSNQWWLPVVFLTLYALFFTMTGLNQLAFSALQGKLIQANRRGRLLTIAGLVGAISAVLCAWFVLPKWLEREGGGFGLIFAVTALGFLCSGSITLLIREPYDTPPERESSSLIAHFQRAWETYRSDRNFRRLAWASMLFMSSMMLFPHYQALGREHLGCEQRDLLGWLVAQNLGTGAFSLLTGTIADWYGNRLCVRVCMFLAGLAPLVSLGLAFGQIPGGREMYWLTFLMLGLTPVTVRCLVNYALELVDESGHTRYVSTLTLTMALPFLFSPLVGWLVDLWGFAAVFLGVLVLVIGSGVMTFFLVEPRHAVE